MGEVSRLALVVVALGVLLSPASARAAEERVVERYGPIELSPYEVERGDEVFNIPKPEVDGFITHMEASLVYADGREVPIANTMLHHVVMLDIGTHLGDKRDATCDSFRRFDSRTYLPLRGQRFFGLGEERQRLVLPEGYGYRTRAADRWAMTFMLMNHRPESETVFIEYRMRIETERELVPVTPVWLDVRDCNLDPVYDVPGGARRGATAVESTTWSPPVDGRLVFAGGHLHGGGRELRLSKPDCGDQTLLRSRPRWGRASHPYYRVQPLLHEPGPIAMRTMTSAQGVPVAAGERVRLDSVYDARRPHARVMGILLAAFAPSEQPLEPCAPLPDDRRQFFTHGKVARPAPRVEVPLTAIGRSGRVRAIRRPAGRTVRMRRDAVVDVRGFRFWPRNVSVRRGATVRWSFHDRELHNVTFANGPRAFSSDNLDDGGSYERRLTTPGTYRLYCTLHPVAMPATVRVRP